MNIDQYETHGRRLMVEFTCYRCGTKVVRPLEACMNEVAESGYRRLYDLHPPTGWQDGGFYYPMFCPECREEYDLFMKGNKVIK